MTNLTDSQKRAMRGEQFPCECDYDGEQWEGSQRCAHCGGLLQFWTERNEESSGRIRFDVMERGVTWTNSDNLRPVITVEVWPPEERYGGTLCSSEVSWPSTSDKRPELAAQLSVALARAASEAKAMNEEVQS